MQVDQKKSENVYFIGISGFASCEAMGRWLTLEPPPRLPAPAELLEKCSADLPQL
jgi:hypothetical protein